MKYTVSSTDIVVIMGLSPYDSPVSLFLKKTGKVAPKVETFQMRLGKKLEPVVRELLLERGIIVTSGGFDFRRHPEREEFIAVPDGFSVIDGKPVVVEQKASLHRRLHHDYFETQLRWQMMVCQCDGLLAILTPDDISVEIIQRDLEKEKMMIEAADWFLDLLYKNEMPSIDNYHPATLAALKSISRVDETVDIGDALTLVEQIQEKKAAIKKIEEEVELLSSKLLALMGDANRATCGDYIVRIDACKRKPSLVINTISDDLISFLKEKGVNFKINEETTVSRLIIKKKKESEDEQ